MIKRYKEFLKESYGEYEDDFDEDDFDKIALDYVNQYYRDEEGDAPYGSYMEILDRVDSFCKDDFPYGLENIPDPLILYRLLVVKSEDEINKDNLGEYYVGDKEMFDDSEFLHSTSINDITEDDHKWFIVTIETSPNNLNYSSMLGNRAEYPTEYQFTLKNDKNLKILNIEETDIY